ncbi:MAG: hypothetical protein DHS20C14_14990 [Phycisphaeraceae bacterium]|nr:MAG: hypothetical protein DHS20C14_14990 [Phycisphaeraceae bacterium]
MCRYHRRVTLVCVPIMVEDIDAALRDATAARDAGADLIEWRIDSYFSGSTGSDAEDGVVVSELQRLLAESPLPTILTCRPTWECGEYDGDDADRIALFEKLCTGDAAPAYLDVELAAYTRSANIRQKIDLCVDHPNQKRDLKTKLILSIHDFEQRPADLDRRVLTAYDAPACAVVKVAYRARSLRDNLDLFELTRGAPKPTIALGMGEFGLMSRVLAPKFGGYLTFASLRDEAASAPGQPTIDDLLSLYRFRSIGRETKVYGVIGWPVGHSLSPHVHNAGFEAIGFDRVYLPLPIAANESDEAASDTSFRATLFELLLHEPLDFAGASVTMPHKTRLASLLGAELQSLGDVNPFVGNMSTCHTESANTLAVSKMKAPGKALRGDWFIGNTDTGAIQSLLFPRQRYDKHVGIIGTGGVARAAFAAAGIAAERVTLFGRSIERAEEMAAGVDLSIGSPGPPRNERRFALLGDLPSSSCDIYINCTPVGMAGGPDPDALSIPVPDMPNVGPDTVFFDTVYNPVETPMLKAARARGCKTIDGVEMFVRQAAAQFELWTGKPAPTQLFDRICREKLADE